MNRRDALLGAAAGALALAAPARASDSDGLERLLGLERRLEAAYEAALARDAIDPALGRLLLGHEREHVRGLEQALGGRPRRRRAGPQGRARLPQPVRVRALGARPRAAGCR